MFTSRSRQTRLERIDSDAVLWSIFSVIVIRDKKKKKRVKFYSKDDSKYFCFHKQCPQFKHKSVFCWWDNDRIILYKGT